MAAAGGGAGGGGGGGRARAWAARRCMQGAELLGSLTQLQLDGLAALGAGATLPSGEAVTATTNILHELKTSSVGSSMGQMDAMTLDIVARLFDQLFDDPKIPLGAKGLIGRLQIPMLKVAIADKDLFSQEGPPGAAAARHAGRDRDPPARRLQHREQAVRPPRDHPAGADHRLQGRRRDLRHRARPADRAHAARGRAHRGRRRARPPSASCRRRRSRWRRARRRRTSARACRRHPLPGPVLEFIIEQWIKLMMLIHVKRGPASEPWKHAHRGDGPAHLERAAEGHRRGTPQARDRRAACCSSASTAGLQVAGIEDEVREQFFTALMRYHTEILSAPPKGAAAPMPAARAGAAPARARLHREHHHQEPVRRRRGAGERAGRGSRGDGGAHLAPATDPDALRQGDWVEWKERRRRDAPAGPPDLHHARARPATSSATASEKDYIECTRCEIVRRLRAGEAVLMEEEPEVPFFERIMGGVISKMKSIAAPA